MSSEDMDRTSVTAGFMLIELMPMSLEMAAWVEFAASERHHQLLPHWLGGARCDPCHSKWYVGSCRLDTA